MVEINNVKKIYGSRAVLDIPNLKFEPGKRYAVIGANGSGKSTLLKIIAGVLQPDTGSVEISPEINKNRGYMPQHPYVFGFSTLKNVTIALNDKLTAEKDAIKVLNELGMGEFIRQKGKALSGGEAQRMAIARMIAQPRGLVILDEPTSATDIAGNDIVESALLRYSEETGGTMIFATHSPAQAQRLGDIVIMLDKGIVVENGPAEQIINDPQSEQGALFLKHWKLKGTK